MFFLCSGYSGGLGERCKDQLKRQPVKVQVPAIDPRVAFMVAMLVALGAMLLACLKVPSCAQGIGAGGPIAVGAVILLIIIGAMLASSDAYAATPEPCCIPNPLGRHQEGQPWNMSAICSDLLPPNTPDSQGRMGDWKVNGKYFDALGEFDGALWETKTHNFDNYSDDGFLEEVITPLEILKILFDVEEEYWLAKRCKFTFKVGVGDARLAAVLSSADAELPMFDELVVNPELCLQPAY